MKEINMYVRGVVKNIDVEPYRTGFWVTVLEYNNHRKVLKGTCETDKNGRAMLIGIIEGVKKLKEPCIINLYTHAIFFNRTKKDRKEGKYNLTTKGTHEDLLIELDKLITENKHDMNINIGGKMQNELIKLMNY